MIQSILKISMVFIVSIVVSCSHDRNNHERGPNETTTYDNPVPELSQEQQSAFDALNTLQTNTDEMNRLYSTFANVDQPFYPADTSFTISQSELLTFMQQYISKNCQNLHKDVQDELARASVLAQEEYTVLYCNTKSVDQNFENGLPMSGTWVMPNVLGRRDVIMVW